MQESHHKGRAEKPHFLWICYRADYDPNAAGPGTCLSCHFLCHVCPSVIGGKSSYRPYQIFVYGTRCSRSDWLHDDGDSEKGYRMLFKHIYHIIYYIILYYIILYYIILYIILYFVILYNRSIALI